MKIVASGSQTTKTQTETVDDNSDEDEPKTSKQAAFKGISMEDFSQLVIPKSVMQDGILFIWVEKEYVMEVVKFLESQEFYYVENMCWVMLNEEMREGKIHWSLIFTNRGREDSNTGCNPCIREGGLHLSEEVQENSHDVQTHQQARWRWKCPWEARA